MTLFKVEDYRPGTDQAVVDAAIAAANAEATSEATLCPVVEFAAKTYELTTSIVANGINLRGEATGLRSTILNWNNPVAGTTFVTMDETYGGSLSDIRISASGTAVDDLVGLHTISQGIASFERFEIDLSRMGMNGTCLVSQRPSGKPWQESVSFRNFKLTGPRPVHIINGNNLEFMNYDIGAWTQGTPVTDAHEAGDTYPYVDDPSVINACFHLEQSPGFIVIGPGSLQQGDHAFYLNNFASSLKDSSIVFRDSRYEQGRNAKTGIDSAAFVLRCERAGRLNAIKSVSFYHCQAAPGLGTTPAKDYLSTSIQGSDRVYASPDCSWTGGHAGQWTPKFYDYLPAIGN